MKLKLPNLRSYTVLIAAALVIADVFIGIFIIHKIAYTEIDWAAYMQEVKGFLDGERNYSLLRGDTGPLVYPAGFVYIFSFLFWLTNEGSNILRGKLDSFVGTSRMKFLTILLNFQ